jgi:LysM repeat protein/ABC-type branched-subunit amino acid transport system substrate-binding protein
MRKSLKNIIVSLILAVSASAGIATEANAQGYENTPVTISREKVKVGGQVCYSHVVLEKQTLFSIAKAYNVSIDDIYRLNPSVKEKGLQKNSIIIIPAVPEAPQPVQASPLAAKEPESPDDMPETPQTRPESQDAPKATRTHTVRWFEDIDIIAQKYEVTPEAIMQANNLKSRKLSKRQRLVIPAAGEVIVTEDETVDEVKDSVATDALSQQEENPSGLLFPKRDPRISVMLPLKANGSASSAGNMDVYSGFLLAVRGLSEDGTGSDLSIYDVADGKMSATKEGLEESDMIIGPVSPADIERVHALAPEAKALISPLDQRAAGLSKLYSGMIQVPTPQSLQYKDLMSWIREDMEYSDRMLVISEKGGKQTDATLEMKAAADSSGLEFKSLEYSILEGRNVTSSLEYLMTESGTNRVFIASDSEAFVNDVVRNLNLMIYNKYSVILYAPSKIRSFETIEVENFHNTSLHVSTGYYIDYEDPRVQEFLLQYRALFNTEPSQFAFQGYDIAKYFLSLYAKYGNSWTEKIEGSDASMLQSTFRFRKQNEGGYINTGVRRIVYGEGWSVVKTR